jgi:hypothetical protein
VNLKDTQAAGNEKAPALNARVSLAVVRTNKLPNNQKSKMLI